MPSKTKESDNNNKLNKKVKQNSFEIEVVNPSTNKESATTVKEKKVSSKTKSKKTNRKKTVKVKTSTIKKESRKKNYTKSKKTSITSKNKTPIQVVEYYDLPYRYNETIVKILYQTPNTLFVYWDISDSDRETYIKRYGENFFDITRPVLIIHNISMNYSFEVPINDFANSWYLSINDSKCNYTVELGRRPNYYNADVSKEIEKNIHTDYIYISTSNKIESPNDHVLFNTNENNTVKFRNIKTSEEKSISLFDIVKKLPGMQNISNIPYISYDLLMNIYSEIYENKDISLFDRINNPSSGNMSSRFH